MEEPSVLDYVKSLLTPWKGQRIHLPPVPPKQPQAGDKAEGESISVEVDEPADPSALLVGLEEGQVDETRLAEPVKVAAPEAERPAGYRWPWRSLVALVLALVAQTALEPPGRNAFLGMIFYGLAGALLVWAIVRHEWALTDLGEDAPGPMPLRIQPVLLGFGVLLAAVAFLTFTHDRFTLPNLGLGLLAVIYMTLAFRVPPNSQNSTSFWRRAWQDLQAFFRRRTAPSWGVLIAALLVLGLVLFFRLYRLNEVPGEMFSDHAEKLLDVMDVLDGKTSIFFPRNTGREAIQFYLTAAIINLLGTGVSFLSLKIGTALIGLLTLPYIYLLGREVGGKGVGWFALVLAAIAYWPNVIARVGLRFPLYPLFAAPTLYYLIRGLRRQNRNDFIWSGIALGLGLHGYSTMRIVPFILVILIVLYLLHRQARGKRQPVVLALALLAVISLVVFLPLLSYALESPVNMSYFGMRAFSRLGPSEQSLPAPAIQVFLDNLGKAWIMPFWDNGQIWVHSIPGRPALDIVGAALYFIGSVAVLVRYLRRRHWIDLFLLVSVPLLMLPSILSLAFPDENPSLNRTGAAYIPIFILAAIGLEGLLKALRRGLSPRMSMALSVLIGAALFVRSATQNYDLVFNQYAQEFMAGTWNTDQIGEVIHEYATTIGSSETAYVIPYPYWVDTRLVGINAGFPRKDFALQPGNLTTTQNNPGPKLFILKTEDIQTLALLRTLYPQGLWRTQTNPYPGKDFIIFTVIAN